jgi:hypothetical protein
VAGLLSSGIISNGKNVFASGLFNPDYAIGFRHEGLKRRKIKHLGKEAEVNA